MNEIAQKRPGVWTRLYDWMLNASAHPHARWYLGAVSFAESSFFPLPPDIMLAPMTLATPRRWWSLALLTTLASLGGGVLGWLIGVFAIEAAMPVIEAAGYAAAYATAQRWFDEYGVIAVIVAGFTPIPYKVFTISAGAAAMPLLPFAIASFLGRGARFFLVAALIRALGPRIEPRLRRFIDWLGWAFLALVALGFAALNLL